MVFAGFEYFCTCMKLFFRFLLSFCFILFCGIGQPYAHTQQDRVVYPPANTLENLGSSCFSYLHKSAAISIRTASQGVEKQDEKIDDTDDEDEDEDPETHKKQLVHSNYFVTRFSSQSVGFYSRYPKKRLSYCKHFSFSSTNTHIVFRVIRI
jgi:hypothetical protein